MKRDRQDFLSFWTIFCPFTPLITPKKNFEKWKNTPGDIIILHKCPKNHDHMLTDPEIRRMTDMIFIFHLGYFLPPPPPLTTQKIQI